LTGNYDVLFYPGYQSSPQPALAFNNEIVLVHGNCTVAKGIHRNRVQFYSGRFVDIVNDLSGWKKAMEAVRD